MGIDCDTYTTLVNLYKLLGFKELLEVTHLPHARDNQNGQLGDGPPEHTLIGRFTCSPEPLLSILNNNTTKNSIDIHSISLKIE